MPLAYYLHDLSPFVFEFAPGVGPRWYGLAYALGFLAGYAVFRDLARRGHSTLAEEKASEFITWIALLGVFLGGRLGYFLFYKPEMLLQDPLCFFRVWEGGMSSHGGIAGIAIVSLLYARRAGVPWLNLGDNLVVVAPLGLLFGRLANFVNGELYGRVAHVAWAVQFPSELYSLPVPQIESVMERARAIDPAIRTIGELVAGARVDPALETILRGALAPRHPSQLYEALLEGAALFALLLWLRLGAPWWRDRPRLERPPFGLLTGVFFLAYAAARIFCEQFREPDAPLTWIFTRGQSLSLLMIAAGIGFVIASARPRRAR